jgi:hypothetical protein
MGSGSDLISGQDNGFEKTTTMVGQTTDDPVPPPFDGDVIFQVVGFKSGTLHGLNQTCAAIRGHGTNGVSPLTIGGAGVWGMGGPNAGTGVLGQGGQGDPFEAAGGIGVHGQGGPSIDLPDFELINEPGIGVLGEGGLGNGNVLDPHFHPNAPGVVGVAGGTNVPALGTTQNAGVVGSSSTGIGVKGISDKFDGVRGESATSVGVFGQGDTGVEGSGTRNGVLGTGDIAVYGLGKTTGVYGTGPTGVYGASSSEGLAGVFSAGVVLNLSDFPRRAGVFASTSAAQVHLVPRTQLQPFETHATTPGAFVTKGFEAQFPADGKCGDLLCATPSGTPGAPGATATLWFCTISGTGKRNPAWWQQVLLGPIFAGQG